MKIARTAWTISLSLALAAWTVTAPAQETGEKNGQADATESAEKVGAKTEAKPDSKPGAKADEGTKSPQEPATDAPGDGKSSDAEATADEQGGTLPIAPSSIQWQATLEAAFARGKELGRPVMVDFEAEWCGWCKKLDRETYVDEAVVRFASQELIAVKVDVDRRPEVQKRFDVRGLPTLVFFDVGNVSRKPEDVKLEAAREIGRILGFRPAEEFLQEARSIATSGEALAELREQAEKNPKDIAAQRAYARSLVATEKLDAAEKVLRDAVKASGGDAGARLDLAEVLKQRGDLESAAKLLRQVVADASASAEDRQSAPVPLASCLIALGEKEQAEVVLDGFLEGVAEAVDRAAASTPTQPETKPDASDPAAAAAAARKLPPEKIEALFLRSYLLAVRGESERALGDLKLAEQADPLGEWGMRAGFIVRRLER